MIMMKMAQHGVTEIIHMKRCVFVLKCPLDIAGQSYN